jgi:hypothetical protein
MDVPIGGVVTVCAAVVKDRQIGVALSRVEPLHNTN